MIFERECTFDSTLLSVLHDVAGDLSILVDVCEETVIGQPQCLRE